MERKIGGFLPEQTKREIEDLVLQAIENHIDHTSNELALAMEQVGEMWDETTTAKLETKHQPIISKEAILGIIYELGGCDAQDEYARGWDEAINQVEVAVHALDQITTEEPEGVKVRWEEYYLTSLNPETTPDDTECFCGNCENKIFRTVGIELEVFNHCPYCGVKLLWGEEEQKDEQ